MEKHKKEKRNSIFNNITQDIKLAFVTLGKDYSSEDKKNEKELEKLREIQKQVHDEQEEFEKKLRVDSKNVKVNSKGINKRKKEKTEEREI